MLIILFYYNILNNILNNNIIYWLLYFLNFLDKNYMFLLLLLFFFKYLNVVYLYIFILFIIKDNHWLFFIVSSNWPNSLLYGFNNIHPLLFYSVIIIVILIVFNSYLNYKFKLITLLIISSISLLLGMYWGSVNESWGFFWTFDKIELCLLFIVILISIKLHSIVKLNINWLYGYTLLIILFYLTLLRFNILFTVHSFFEKTTVKLILFIYIFLLLLFFYKHTAYINILILFINFFYILKKSYYLYTNKNIKNKSLYVAHISLILLLLLILNPTYYYGIISFCLYNYFNFTNIQYNLLNYFNFIILNNNLIVYSLSTYIKTSYFLFNNYLYSYIYYLGNFYFFFFITLISILKIYFK